MLKTNPSRKNRLKNVSVYFFLFWLALFGLNACNNEKVAPVVEPVEKPAKPPAPPTKEPISERKKESPPPSLQESAMLPGQVQSPYPASPRQMQTDDFYSLPENVYFDVNKDPLSTFSVDVDTASYSVVRRFLEKGELPPKGTVRIEEMINFFPYAYKAPAKNIPCSLDAELSENFWNKDQLLLRIGVKAQEIDWSGRKPSNLVFLLDVSGSMFGPERLPLAQKALRMLVENLDQRDTVSIVVYAGRSGTLLAAAKGNEKEKILNAIDSLQAGGSTHGSAGIEAAYALAKENYIKDGINRIILCTDGDFNVGVTSKAALLDLVREKRESGIFLSVFGFGMGNYKDDMLVKLADNGNGMYAYIDTPLEAKKVLVEQIGSSMITVAKDVKIQVEFNPQRVTSYRLVGYEKRLLQARDFKDDRKDAGEMGSGHTVTALYEIVPAGGPAKGGDIDKLKYSAPLQPSGKHGDEWCTVSLRYKEPDGKESKLISLPVTDANYNKQGSPDMRMAAAVAAFGMLLNNSEYKGSASYDEVIKIVSDPAVSTDAYRQEFIGLAAKAKRLSAGN